MTPFHFFYPPSSRRKIYFSAIEPLPLSFPIYLSLYLISLRAGKGNVEANPDKKPRLFSDSYQIWIQFAIQTTRSASEECPFSLSVFRCFDILVFVSRNRETMSMIQERCSRNSRSSDTMASYRRVPCIVYISASEFSFFYNPSRTGNEWIHVRWKRRERYVDRVRRWQIDEDSMPIQQYDDELSSIPTCLTS